MLFKSKYKPTIPHIMREWVWPKAGWLRWSQYVWRRVWRLADSPHTVAIGLAAGAFASFTPFMGFHFVVAFVAAWVVRGSMLAAAIGTSIGNPLTFPFIWYATFNIGNWILGGKAKSGDVDLTEMVGHVWNEIYFRVASVFSAAPDGPLDGVNNAWLEVFWPLIKPMTVGGLVLGPICGAALYFPVRAAVQSYQTRRRERLIARHLVPSPRGPDQATS
ncbi:hypothetical protein NAS141_09886 [hydrothermal vent metagenome]|uniref:DUF2062 domain-containing protein n=1 Tax=hydrothermal vent metagenome TaxID=652676 RepID=A0A3B0T6U2_9ZZZZ